MNQLSEFGGAWLSTQRESKNKDKAKQTNKQTRHPKRGQAPTLSSSNTEDQQADFFLGVHSGGLDRQCSRLSLHLPALTMKRKRSSRAALEFNNEEQRDGYKSKRKIAPS